MVFKDVGNRCHIIISEHVFREIAEIKHITEENEVEVPFYLFGTQEANGGIFFNRIISETKNLERNFASFTSMDEAFAENVRDYYIREIPDEEFFLNHPFERIVISCCHTHIDCRNSDNFSLRDLEIAVDFANCAPYTRSQYVKVIDMILTSKGELNFILYDNSELFKGFYKYPNVFVRKNDGRTYKLYAYKLGHYGLYKENYSLK